MSLLHNTNIVQMEMTIQENVGSYNCEKLSKVPIPSPLVQKYSQRNCFKPSGWDHLAPRKLRPIIFINSHLICSIEFAIGWNKMAGAEQTLS